MNNHSPSDTQLENDKKPERIVSLRFFDSIIKQNLFKLIEKIEPTKKLPKTLVFPEGIKWLICDILDVKVLEQEKIRVEFFGKDLTTYYERFSDSINSIVIFFTPPDIRMVEQITHITTSYSLRKVRNQNNLVFFPQRTFMIKYDLKKENLMNHFSKIHDFNFDLIRLSEDLLSLEFEHSIREIFVTREYNCHNVAAESLYRIKTIFGRFKTVMVKGKIG